MLLGFKFDGNNNSTAVTPFIKGVAQTQGAGSPFTSVSMALSGNSTGGFFDGIFCEALAYSRALTQAEIDILASYAINKWAIP